MTLSQSVGSNIASNSSVAVGPSECSSHQWQVASYACCAVYEPFGSETMLISASKKGSRTTIRKLSTSTSAKPMVERLPYRLGLPWEASRPA